MAGFSTTDEAALERPDAVAHGAAMRVAVSVACSSGANRHAEGVVSQSETAKQHRGNVGEPRVAAAVGAKRGRAILASWLAAGLAVGQAGFVVAAELPMNSLIGHPQALPRTSAGEEATASMPAAMSRVGAPRARIARADGGGRSSAWSAPRPIGRSHQPVVAPGSIAEFPGVVSARPRRLPQPAFEPAGQAVSKPGAPMGSTGLPGLAGPAVTASVPSATSVPGRWASWQSTAPVLSGPENFNAEQIRSEAVGLGEAVGFGDAVPEPFASAFAPQVSEPVAEVKSPPQARSESLTVVQLLRDTLQYQRRGQQLLDRGAIYAAHDVVVKSLHAAATANDVGSGNRASGQALSTALRAFQEAGDFLGRYGHPDAERMRGMVASHSTPILKDCTLVEIAPLEAANIYLDFARERLTTAVAGRPEAAESLRLLGEIERRRDCYPESMRDALAISCLRAAVATDLGNAELVGELGSEVSRLGLLKEARWALESSLALKPSREVLSELITTCERSGDRERAVELAAQLRAWGGAPAANQLDVLQLSPGEFASISPPVQNGSMAAPVPVSTGPMTNGPMTAGPANASPVVTSPVVPGARAEAGDAKEVSVLDRVASAVRSILQ